MKLRAMVTGSFLALSLVMFGIGSAYADNQTIDLSSGSASFIGTGTLLSGGSDVITFTNLSGGTYNFDFTMSSQYANISNVFVNNQAATQVAMGTFRFFGLTSLDTAPFAVSIFGSAASNALYSGEMQVTRVAVPEPSTLLLMFLGMGVAYLVSRHKFA